MFCPRCGQEQTSEHTRFCSRCGFLLDTISEVLANGGVLPQLLELNEKKTLLTRKNGILFSIFWFTFFIFLTAVGGFMDIDFVAGMSALIGVFGAFLIFIASLILLKKNSSSRFTQENFVASSHKNLSGSQLNALPPQQSQPVENYASPANEWNAPRTGEFAVKPPSVTEETTKLLQKDE